MAALSNGPLVEHLKWTKGGKVENEKTKEALKIESQFKRFFSSLKEANKSDIYVFVTGVSPLCLTEFTSGFNHSYRISDTEQFAELYGFTEEDISRGLDMIQPPIPQETKRELLRHCDIYDGYRFHKRQNIRLFNSGRILYFLAQVREHWMARPNDVADLLNSIADFRDDAQTRPAEETLKCISTSKVSKEVLHALLKEPNATLAIEKDVDPYFQLNKLHEDRNHLIAFMYVASN